MNVAGVNWKYVGKVWLFFWIPLFIGIVIFNLWFA